MREAAAEANLGKEDINGLFGALSLFSFIGLSFTQIRKTCVMGWLHIHSQDRVEGL